MAQAAATPKTRFSATATGATATSSGCGTGRIVVFGSAGAYLSSTSHWLGVLDLAIGNHDQAVAHLEEAVAVNERAGALPWLARARYDLARALASRGGAGDAERAGQLVAEADRTAEQLGMERLLEKISDRLPSQAG
jgi:hypothetical protein